MESLYTPEMMRHDSDRALKSAGQYARRLAEVIYDAAQDLKPQTIPSILIILPLMTSLIIHTAKFA